MILGRCIGFLFFTSLSLLTANVTAQTYPDKPVRVIVAFPPGGSNDVVSRIVFQKIAAGLGQQFVIDNRGGAAGVIGAAAVAKSPPDGYTVLIHSTTLIFNAHLKKPPYDTLNDFVGITPLAEQVFMLVVHPSLPVYSTKEFIALAKKRPGDILYSSGGNGTPLHLAMAMLESMTQTRLVHVQYSGGAPAVTSVVAGETQAIAANVGVVAPHIKAKRLRALGVTSSRRVAQFPEIPPLGDVVRGYDFTAWIGLFAPAGTPPAIVEKLNAEIRNALDDPGVSSKLSGQTMDPMYMTAEKFSQRLKSDFDKYGKLIRDGGIKGD